MPWHPRSRASTGSCTSPRRCRSRETRRSSARSTSRGRARSSTPPPRRGSRASCTCRRRRSRTPVTLSRAWGRSPRIRMPRTANTPVPRPRPSSSRSRAPTPRRRSSPSARTSCGVRATRSSSRASSPAHAGGRCRSSTAATALIDSTYVDNAASGIVAALDRVEAVSGRAYVLTNGEPRPVGDLLAGICLASGVTPPRFSVPAGLAKAAGSLIERVWAVRPGQTNRP